MITELKLASRSLDGKLPFYWSEMPKTPLLTSLWFLLYAFLPVCLKKNKLMTLLDSFNWGAVLSTAYHHGIQILSSETSSSNLRNSILEWPGDTPSHMTHGFNMDNLQGNRFLLKNKNYQNQDLKKKKNNPDNLDTPFQEKNHSSLSGKKIRAALEQVIDQKDWGKHRTLCKVTECSRY